MAITQGAGPSEFDDSATAVSGSVTVALGMTLTAGRTLVVGTQANCYTVAGATLTSVVLSGSNTNTLTKIGSVLEGALDSVPDEAAMQLAYLSHITSSGATTITATWGGLPNVNVGLIIIGTELIGCDTTAAYDTGAENGSTGNSGTMSTSVNTNVAGDAIVCMAANQNSQNPTWNNSFVQIASSARCWTEQEAQNLAVGGAGSHTVSATVTSGNWLIKAAAFKQPSTENQEWLPRYFQIRRQHTINVGY